MPRGLKFFGFLRPAPNSDIYCSDLDSAFEIWDAPGPGQAASEDEMRANALFASLESEDWLVIDLDHRARGW